MKRTVAMIACLCMLFHVMTGCSGKETESETTVSTQTQETGETLETTASETQTGETRETGGTEPTETQVVDPGNTSGDVPPPVLLGVVKQPADGIGTPGVDFKLLETGPVEGWDEKNPAPYFNPLGSKKLYAEAYADPRMSTWGVDLLEGSTPKRFVIEGTYWLLKIQHPDLTRNWLLYQAREMGAVVYPTTPDRAVFSVMEGDAVRWWVIAELSQNGNNQVAYCRIYRTNLAASGKTVTIIPSQLPGTTSYKLYTDCVPGKLQTVTVTLKGEPSSTSGVAIQAKQEAYENGVYQSYTTQNLTTINWGRTSTVMGERFVFDNVPMVDGMMLWSFDWRDSKPTLPDEITFTIQETADVPSIQWGDQLGMVRIIGAVDGGGARLEDPWNKNIKHLIYDKYKTLASPWQDQDGNYCLVAPAGYYTLTLAQETFKSNQLAHESKIQLVPVSAGKITTVTIPDDLLVTYGEMLKSFSSFDSKAGSIDIQTTIDNGATAQIALVIKDKQERELLPELTDFQITENGLDGKVVKVDRTIGSANVVLVIDSSGSMGSNMGAAVAAAKRFVESLPENSAISVVQFAQAITEHPGTTKAEAQAALDKIKSDGATSLYDATALALKKLQGKERPYVVVFSDGADSREPGISGDGSKMSLDQLVAQVGSSGAAVLTIGFGAGHDPKALIAMSEASKNGGYFVAADKDSLDSAFAVVSTKFGNQYVVTYERPTAIVDQDSDVPVVSIMMDASGSMDMDPTASPGNDVDYRLDRVKNVFHQFIMDLPQGTLMQFNTFFTPTASTPRSHFLQLTTDQKALILRGIASVQAGGGTPIVEALNTALLELAPIPSSKKVLVFMTDAALSVKDDGSGAQQAKLDEVLAKLKKAGIRVLFTGLGGADYALKYDDVFRHAAEVAGGDYVITANVADIAAKLADLLTKVNIPAAAREEISLAVKLDCLTDDGSRTSFAATRELIDFSARQTTGQVIKPDIVKVAVTDEPYVEYDREASQLLYGSDSPTTESIITMRIPFADKSAGNDFAVLKVSEAFFMDTFKGIKAPDGQHFLALQVNLDFQKADAGRAETGYCVPSVFQHFYVSCNNGRMMPASQATWLTEQPFARPGEASVTVTADQPRSGMLVFLIDKRDRDELSQLSLHLYDTDYGHINMPLVGGVADEWLAMGDLPKTAPADISDAFALTATGLTDVNRLAGIELTTFAKEKNTTFRVLETSFVSKVQALLNIDPMKRFYYAIDTDSGLLMTRMSDVVYNLPFGFTGSTMLAPASANQVRMPFVLPAALLQARANLMGDIRQGHFTLPLNSGAAYATASAGTQRFEHEYFTLTVNSLVSQAERSRSVVLDFTVSDKQDGMGTSGFDAIMNLELKSVTAQSNTSSDRLSSSGKVIQDAVNRKGLSSLDASSLESKLEQLGVKAPDLIATRRLIFGASEDDGAWGVFDGQSRRGILIFNLPGKGELNEWVLTSSLIPGLNLPVQAGAYAHPELLSEKPPITVDTHFEDALSAAVKAAVSAYRATRQQIDSTPEVALSDEDLIGKQTPSPSLTLYGSQVIAAVATDQDFFNVMNRLSWIPANRSYLNFSYAPESVITQGWGTQHDLFVLAQTLLARLGYRPETRQFKLSQLGKDNLMRIYGVTDVPDKLPALAYVTADGTSKVYVPVLGHDVSEMTGLGILSMEPLTINPAKGMIRVYASGELTGNAGAAAQQALVGGFGAILGGSEGTAAGSPINEDVPLLEAEVNLDEIGLDDFDLSFLAVGKSEDGLHDKVTAVAETRSGLLKDPNLWIDTASYILKSVTVELSTPTAEGKYQKLTHTVFLDENDALTDLFMTLAFNTPEMTDPAAEAYAAAVEREVKAASSPSDYSIDRWYGHATLNRLTKVLTDYDNELCAKLDLVTGRQSNPVALAFTLQKTAAGTVASVDLINHNNQVINGEAEAAKAYHLMLGLFASQAEASVLTSGKGLSYLDNWAALPDDAGFIVVDSKMDERTAAAKVLADKGFPALLCQRLLLKTPGMENTAFIIPTAAATAAGDGTSRWAWLELDTRTYEVVSMFDNGERSGMANYVLGMKPKNAVEFADGALVGITCSDVSVATYALRTEDYADIMMGAEALAFFAFTKVKEFQGNIKDLSGVMKDPVEAIKGKGKSTVMGAIKKRTGINVADLYKLYKGKTGEPSFSDGFEAVLKLYFMR